jgi:hypothetical protein
VQNPTVTFVIPCYKLGHLLAGCVNSILAQTFSDFEILIMDDCSPDNTSEVASSFHDPRVKHIRNNVNQGHLRNYNKGINLSRGKYLWLISADDYLRRPYILERYVELMEKNPRVGYAFCPGVGVRNGIETGVMDYSVYGSRDQIINGRVFLKKLLNYNLVVAASAMARRECYEKISVFPLDVAMGWSGDWFLWGVFALLYDVAYFAEPMVCYRQHELSMTSTLTRQENIHICSAGDIAVPWMIRAKANELGLRKVSEDCLLAVAQEYARQCSSKAYQSLAQSCTSSISLDEFEKSLCQSTNSEEERNWIRARVFAGIADSLCLQGDLSSARKLYIEGIRKDARMPKVYAKLLLVLLGKRGEYVRTVFRLFRSLALNFLSN